MKKKRKCHSPEQIVKKLRDADVMLRTVQPCNLATYQRRGGRFHFGTVTCALRTRPPWSRVRSRSRLKQQGVTVIHPASQRQRCPSPPRKRISLSERLSVQQF